MHEEFWRWLKFILEHKNTVKGDSLKQRGYIIKSNVRRTSRKRRKSATHSYAEFWFSKAYIPSYACFELFLRFLPVQRTLLLYNSSLLTQDIFCTKCVLPIPLNTYGEKFKSNEREDN